MFCRVRPVTDEDRNRQFEQEIIRDQILANGGNLGTGRNAERMTIMAVANQQHQNPRNPMLSIGNRFSVAPTAVKNSKNTVQKSKKLGL